MTQPKQLSPATLLNERQHKQFVHRMSRNHNITVFTSYLCIMREQINHFLYFRTRINMNSARQKNPAWMSCTGNLCLARVHVITMYMFIRFQVKH
jgi:hypothetical protein